MKSLVRLLSSGKVLCILALITNLILLYVCDYYLHFYAYHLISIGFALLLLIYHIIRGENMTHIIFCFAVSSILPLVGMVFSRYLGNRKCNRRQVKALKDIYYNSSSYIVQDEETINELKQEKRDTYKQAKYILSVSNRPIYQNNQVNYYGNTVEFFDEYIESLKKAKKYIFIELFSIRDSEIWTAIFDVIRVKAREGVDVKLIYDYVGCKKGFKDSQYFEKLYNHGIEAIPFNKVTTLPSRMNKYRTHRKFTVIDGVTAFHSGCNVSDYYYNEHPWKDGGLKITGSAVWNYVITFIEDYVYSTKKNIKLSDYEVTEYPTQKTKQKDYVQPFVVDPIQINNPEKKMFLNCINNAQESLDIVAPYMVLDDEILTALKMASRSGVAISIVVPETAVKKNLFYISRSYYADLIRSGVRIYSYKTTYLHSKLVVCDKMTAVVSSMNLDYRPMYTHFSDGVLVHKGGAIASINKDFDQMKGESHEITIKEMSKRNVFEKLIASIHRLFVPLT
ncbi:MAG: hypothetical protein IJW28_02610 [Clostridia bacterium]|nr:hypothetical protein [Clostridia bacterium]